VLNPIIRKQPFVQHDLAASPFTAWQFREQAIDNRFREDGFG